jgi:hypothetical protein
MARTTEYCAFFTYRHNYISVYARNTNSGMRFTAAYGCRFA